jgi:BioD-like phosphotransacetylase family protein
MVFKFNASTAVVGKQLDQHLSKLFLGDPRNRLNGIVLSPCLQYHYISTTAPVLDGRPPGVAGASSYSQKYGLRLHDQVQQQQQQQQNNQRQQYDSIRGNEPSPKWESFPNGSRFWKKQRLSGRRQRPIFVAATRQHVGKTTCSLAIISGLQKRYDKVGFLKPVGQQHVPVFSNEMNETIRVDKDVCLIREYFHLNHIDYKDMSPVIIPDGYTRKYVDGEISLTNQIDIVTSSMSNVASASDVVLLEGTGHCAVGSIVGLNNAKVASLIGADMVLVANGGLGSAFDELELNRVLCQHYNVRVAGVILNKVIPSKLEQTTEYMRRAMFQTWGIPLLACIPDHPFLGCPALADLETLFKTKLICGSEHRYRHYDIQSINVVTTSLTRFLENLREKPSRTLYICHITRDDLIVGFMGEYQRRREQKSNFEAALIICGRKEKYELSPEVYDMLKSLDGAPVMVVDLPTYAAMQKIHKFTPKLNIDDTNRVQVAIDHYEPYIDFDELTRRTTAQNSSFNDPSSISLDELRIL